MRETKLFFLAIILVTSLLVSGALVATQVYKSTDSQGNTTYSDQVSPSAESVKLNTAPIGNSQAVQQNQQLQKQQNIDADQKQQAKQENQKTEKQQDEQERLKKLCDNSRSNLALLQEKGRRVYTVKPDGEYHYFSEEERQQEVERLNAQIKQYCQ